MTVLPLRSTRRRAAATLAVVAVALPLAGLPTRPATAAPVGRVSSVLEDECDPANPTLIAQTPPGLLQLGAESANTVATGNGITVAVVDSGVDARNVHLSGGVVEAGRDVTPAGTPNGQTDLEGHGTAIAGEIAARKVEGSGVIGLAYGAKILPIRVYTRDAEDAAASGTVEYPPTASSIALGIQTAAQLGAKIINVSLSTDFGNAELQGAVTYATRRGALIVASAGNRDTSKNKKDTPRYPGAYPDVLAVAAVDNTGSVTESSIHGSYVDVAAPGVNILTAFRNADDCIFANEDASTSYATAYVSAAAALIAEAHPTETPAQWRYRLEVTALRVRPDTRDDNAGWGVIQPYEALTFISDGTAAGPRDPAITSPPTPEVAPDTFVPPVTRQPDTTARDQTLWLTLGGVVAVLALALVALLRRDRKPQVRPKPRTPSGAR